MTVSNKFEFNVKTVFQPMVWLILLGALHTVATTSLTFFYINDIDFVSEIIARDLNITTDQASDMTVVRAWQVASYREWVMNMMWSVIFVVGIFWMKGPAKAKLCIAFGIGMILIGVLVGYFGAIFYDGFNVTDMIVRALFGIPLIVSGYLHLKEE